MSAYCPNPDLLLAFVFNIQNVNKYHIGSCRLNTIKNFCFSKNVLIKLLFGRRETPRLGFWFAPRIHKKREKLH